MVATSLKRTGKLWQAFPNIAEDEMRQIKQQMDKNFGLTEATFQQMVHQLEQGDESIYEQVFLTHFKSSQQYLINTYRASQEDAYDACMNALLEFCKRLKAGKIQYGNLRFLFTRMAGQIYFRWIKRQKLTEELSDFDLPEPSPEVDEDLLETLHKAWAQLGPPCQDVLRDFYYEGVSLNSIAERLGRSPVAIRKQKQRCMEKLRQLFAKFHR
ncbi:MAG: sigma-70 family RNA polymerase sigma factor [Bacteroidota bacterium]